MSDLYEAGEPSMSPGLRGATGLKVGGRPSSLSYLFGGISALCTICEEQDSLPETGNEPPQGGHS